MRIEDRFMWNTIEQVIPHATQEIKEEIYKKLFGKTWTIAEIERLYAERIKK